jgi:hypothetical protein
MFARFFGRIVPVATYCAQKRGMTTQMDVGVTVARLLLVNWMVMVFPSSILYVYHKCLYVFYKKLQYFLFCFFHDIYNAHFDNDG